MEEWIGVSKGLRVNVVENESHARCEMVCRK